MCTQMMSSQDAAEEIEANKKSTQPSCASCKLIFPRMKNRPADLSGADQSFDNQGSETSLAAANSALSTPLSSMRTVHEDYTFISSSSPASKLRFDAVRQACLRLIPSEHTFNDSTPMLFSDPDMGTALVLNFQVADDTSRGSVRRYSLMCLCQDEIKLTHCWNTVTSHFQAIVKKLQSKANKQVQRASEKKQVTNRYLRTPRDSAHPPRSLASMVDDMIFVDVHARFVRLLLNLQTAST